MRLIAIAIASTTANAPTTAVAGNAAGLPQGMPGATAPPADARDAVPADFRSQCPLETEAVAAA